MKVYIRIFYVLKSLKKLFRNLSVTSRFPNARYERLSEDSFGQMKYAGIGIYSFRSFFLLSTQKI